MDWRGQLPVVSSGGGNPFDQNLNTFDTPSFRTVTLTDSTKNFSVAGVSDFKSNVFVNQFIDTIGSNALVIGNANATQLSYGSGPSIQHYFNGTVNVTNGITAQSIIIDN